MVADAMATGDGVNKDSSCGRCLLLDNYVGRLYANMAVEMATVADVKLKIVGDCWYEIINYKKITGHINTNTPQVLIFTKVDIFL